MRPSRGPHARKPLRLLALGGATLVDADGVAVVEQRRRVALLVLIAAGRGKRVSRDKLVSYLNPESSAESARHALHQLLYYIRQQAGEDILLGTDALCLNTAVVTSDAVEFEEALDRGDLDAAVALYRGPFLDGFHVAESHEFDEWCTSERARLAARHVAALFRLAERADAVRDHAESIRLWTRIAETDPFDGPAASGLIRAYGAAGDTAAALRHAARYESGIRAELGAEPDPNLVAYVATLRATARGVSRAEPNEASRPSDTAASSGREETGAPRASSPVASTPERRRRLLPVAAAVVIVAGAATAWNGRIELLPSVPAAPPAHDSLRLRVVTASVQSDLADTTLARKVRDAALAAMAEDPWIFVVTPEAWRQQGPLIGLSESALALPDTIRKYARKVRTHAIVDFSVSRVGTGFVITAEARSASTDSSLGVIAEAVSGAVDLPNAMNSLSRRLRERLVGARATLPPTQWSLNAIDQPAQAIELYVEARSESGRGNYIESARRAKAAVEVDSTFALAWRLVHLSLANANLSVDDQLHAISAAFRFSNRVRAPYWRLDIVSAYYRAIGDHERALVFYDSIGLIEPVRNVNAGMSYGALRRYELAERGYRRFANSSPPGYITQAHPNIITSLLDQRKFAEAQREVALMMKTDSMHARTFASRGYVFTVLREWDSLSVLGNARLESSRNATDSVRGLEWVANAAIARGQFEPFDRMSALTATLLERSRSPGDSIAEQLTRARLQATVAGDTIHARAIADAALALARWASLKPMDRPYLPMLLYLASVHDVKRGADVALEWSRATPREFKLRDSLNVLVGRGELAIASGNARKALRLFRLADVRGCEQCFYPRYARAFDALRESDSARVWFERYAEASTHSNAIGDAVELAHAYRRLGELAEIRGDSDAAAGWYGRFTALWASSDTPSLQAQVREIGERITKLRK